MDVDMVPSCRLCIKGAENLINIFDENGLSQNIANILTQHFWFEVKACDDYSHTICSNCWLSVQNFHSFYIQIENVHSTLFDNVRDNIKVEIIENLAQDWIKDSKSEDKLNIYQCSDENNKYAVGTEVKPEESEDDCKVSENESADFSSENEANDSSVEYESDSESQKSKQKTKRKVIKTNSNVKKETELQQIKSEDLQMRGFYKMECELCPTPFETFRNAVRHYRTTHMTKGYIRCCNKKFLERAKLVDHMHRHLNPEAYKCDVCSKLYASKRGLLDHMERHLSSEEKPFKCTQCPKAYTKKNLLTKHQFIHTDDQKLFYCDECGKSFARPTLLHAHKKNVHEGAYVHVCDSCAKVFRTKANYEQHHKSVHSTTPQPKIQCQLCGIWLKDKNILRKHMISHEESKQTHICKQCSKQSPNRKALQNHIRTVHTNNIHECTLCVKAFKQAISLKEHMATHTGEILYTCPHCPKTFNSSANMYSHKKKIHVKEWEEERRLKASGLL